MTGARDADNEAGSRHRTAQVQRWLTLTRDILPGMAGAQDWPIRRDHCFMRVCLDDAIGARWDTAVPRPAVRNLTDAQLARAVAAAERIVADPALLPTMNAASLRMRGKPQGRNPSQPARLTPGP